MKARKSRRPRVVGVQSEFEFLILELCAATLPPPAQPRPRWRDFCDAALRRILSGVGLHADRATHGRQLAEEIVSKGEGAAFLKAARRGRGTTRQNVRVELIREVERLIDVERRRPCANLLEPIRGNTNAIDALKIIFYEREEKKTGDGAAEKAIG